MDRLLNLLIRKKVDNRYDGTTDLIRYKLHLNNKNKKLCIILYPWRSKSIWFWFLRKNLIKKGYSYVTCSYSSAILSSDPRLTKDLFLMADKLLAEKINQLNEAYNFSEVTMIGISLSVVNVLMVADKIPNLKKTILVVPGNDLAESLWCGLRTQTLKNTYLKGGYSLDTLKELWQELAPENNIEKLRGCKTTIFLSKSDVVIPFNFGLKFAEKVKDSILETTVIENKFLGHYATILYFNFISKKYL